MVFNPKGLYVPARISGKRVVHRLDLNTGDSICGLSFRTVGRSITHYGYFVHVPDRSGFPWCERCLKGEESYHRLLEEA